VSCPSAGNCLAGGYYHATPAINATAFTVEETGGTWGQARALVGGPTTNISDASVSSVSCAAAGDCTAVGSYEKSLGNPIAVVADETGGTWGSVRQVPGTDSDQIAYLTSVSCTAPGDCTAGGFYQPSTQAIGGAFAVTETNGVLGNLVMLRVPGMPFDGESSTISVSCSSPGNCTAGGYYSTLSVDSQEMPFVVNETNGRWGTPEQLPGVARLSPHNWMSRLNSIACSSAGACSAGGYYTDVSNNQHAYVANESGGVWGVAIEVPGTAALSAGGGGGGGTTQVNALSCAPGAGCVAGGTYQGSPSLQQAFLVDQIPLAASSTAIALSTAKVTYGREQAERVSVTVSTAAGTPSGKVTVQAGKAAVCTVTLTSGTGSCAIPATKFGPGSVSVAATYAGSASLLPSVSAVKGFTVTRASSKTALALSAGKTTYGHEQSLRFSVSVAPQFAGTPSGQVTVKTGATVLCTIRLAAGKGTCTLSPKRLPVGKYALVASCGGNADFTRSAAPDRTLTVVK
jgi:hypothetical protein